ncbi:MAG: helix-turn-helix transcriptional regulator [Oscillospiraceae bacterium]|nr:helix-turn-helix transcriptional regulator [Oscillospiraceae bacterium]MBR7074978.1 helix-turn-helix transcriptional regulator [Oscillospiraceae bacterium]
MVYCNLSVLLAERQIKITKASLDTGISRTTLTALCQNSCKGIQLDTLNTLCMYLNIQANALFTVFPFDLKIADCTYDESDNTADIAFDYTSSQGKEELHCMATIEIEANNYPDMGFLLNATIGEYDAISKQDKRENSLLKDAFRVLPIPAVESLKNDIVERLIDSISRTTQYEVDGEVYGYPCDPFEWEATVFLPPDWKRGG